jgi:hypothetical protein
MNPDAPSDLLIDQILGLKYLFRRHRLEVDKVEPEPVLVIIGAFLLDWLPSTFSERPAEKVALCSFRIQALFFIDDEFGCLTGPYRSSSRPLRDRFCRP